MNPGTPAIPGSTDLVHWWPQVKAVCNASFRSSLHFAVATVDAQGAPQLTLIGSLLPLEPGRALYFDLFASGLRARLDADPRVCVLAVDSRRWSWIRALWRARFIQCPALRLHGHAGPRRPATAAEQARWLRRVGWLMRLRGARLLWARESYTVRELLFDQVQPVRIGTLTS